MSAEHSSLLDRSRPLPTDGLLQLNDVYGEVDGPARLDDADVVVETVVGNSGRFPDREFRVDAWPDAMTYLATHIVEIRDQQTERLAGDLARLGCDDPSLPIGDGVVEALAERDARVAGRARSVGQQVVEVVQNHAPRTRELEGQNGSIFFVGLTGNGVILYGQEPYLRDLHRDGRIIELHRVRNEDNGGLWPDGHQFRSAEVANSRSIPESRELVYSYPDEAALRKAVEDGTHDYRVPEQGSPLRIVWVDKFGNVVLRLRDSEDYSELLVPGTEVALEVDGQKRVVRVGENLDGANTGQPTIFRNPRTRHPKLVDLAIKSEDCLGSRDHALDFLRRTVGVPVELKDLRKLEIDLSA